MRRSRRTAREPVARVIVPPPTTCWLCGRPLGRKIEQHHPLPKSRGGRETVPVHPICHRAIHTAFTNAELAQPGVAAAVATDPRLTKFLAWIADKPPDFHAPTARRTK